MGVNIRKKILLREEVIMTCSTCNLAFKEDSNFCSSCGKKLEKKTSKVYANMGKKGITSISYKTVDGITINSRGSMTFPMGKGLSYTTSKNK